MGHGTILATQGEDRYVAPPLALISKHHGVAAGTSASPPSTVVGDYDGDDDDP